MRFLTVQLTGTKSNRDGLGATVRVQAANRTFTQYYDGKSGYLSQSSMPLYFGLGEATQVDSVEVRWPSGKNQLITRNLRMNDLLHIREDPE
jgi:hypothetical protein